MPSAADYRPLTARIRPDLVVTHESGSERAVWRVKDPISLEFFEFNEHEHALMQLLDGHNTPADIRQQFERRFAPLRLSSAQLQQFVDQLHEAGLVTVRAAGQGARLVKRRSARRRRENLQRAFDLLAFRFRGVNPQRFLDWLEPRTRWLFTPAFLIAAILLAVSALVLTTVQFDTLRARLPHRADLLTPSRLGSLAVVLAMTKLLHELGHAITCRRFGGSCHELGLMFLVFTPCLYCDVSDSWMIKSRWRRIAISGAGVVVELILAALATWLWWFSQPGLMNSLFFNLMIVCSVGTLLFNGNPLLRYDGYFIFSDLVSESNLAQKSTDIWRGLFSDYLRAVPWSEFSWRGYRRPFLLGAYGLLSATYRWFILVVILWFAYSLCKEHQVRALGHIIVLAALAGAVVPSASAVSRALRDPLFRRGVRRSRAVQLACVAALLLGVALLVPLPRRIEADVVVEAARSRRVYVSVPGKVVFAHRPGASVREGDVLVRLENIPLQRELSRLEGELRRAELLVAEIEARRAGEPEIAAQLPTAVESRADLRVRYRQLQDDIDKLVIRSPADGTILPAPMRIAPNGPRATLVEWTGTPLDEENGNCWVEIGTLICEIGASEQVAPVLMIHEDDAGLVEVGQSVRIVLEQYPARVFSASVADVATRNVQVVPRDLIGMQDLAVETDADGIARPIENWYQARVEFDDPGRAFVLRGRGHARVRVASVPLVGRLLRALVRVFQFKL